MKTLTATQKFTYTISIEDRLGKPAAVDGVPQWASSNPNVATVNPSADGLSCEVVAGVPGVTTISVTADADLGAGVVNLAGTEDVTVTPAAAATIELVGSDPEEQ